jgi:hypothetical protein
LSEITLGESASDRGDIEPRSPRLRAWGDSQSNGYAQKVMVMLKTPLIVSILVADFLIGALTTAVIFQQEVAKSPVSIEFLFMFFAGVGSLFGLYFKLVSVIKEMIATHNDQATAHKSLFDEQDSARHKLANRFDEAFSSRMELLEKNQTALFSAMLNEYMDKILDAIKSKN